MHGGCVLYVRTWREGLITKAEEERGGEDDSQRANLCHEKERYDTPAKHNLLGGRTLHVRMTKKGRTIM